MKLKGWQIGLIAALAVIGIMIATLFGLVRHGMNQAAQMDIWVETLDDSAAERLTHSDSNSFPKFSHDGKKIAFAHSKSLLDKDAPSSIEMFEGGQRSILVEDGRFNYAPAWSADDKSVYYLTKKDKSYRSEIWAYDFETRSKRKINGTLEASEIEISPDGRWMAYIGKVEKRDELFIQPLEGGAKKQLTNTANFLNEPAKPVWLPDSKGILFAGFFSVQSVDLEGKTLPTIDLSPLGISKIHGVMPNPVDGETLIIRGRTGSEGAFSANLYLISKKNPELKIIRKSSLFEMHGNLSPDGTRMVYCKPRGKK